MEITEVRITLRDEPKLKAFANITLDDCFVIRGLKIIEGVNGFFISMPSRKGKDGTYRDIAHPINNETRERIETVILEEYKKELSKQGVETDNVKITKRVEGEGEEIE
ncbi:septation regulator SpoVG [candidate division WOR-3 bacterium]|nr:septation regulator SpoVG [candidate division WOR-3 bacterium]MCK4584508.1 septation regulator SpoVG [candidate division WOR-3 bacterium]